MAGVADDQFDVVRGGEVEHLLNVFAGLNKSSKQRNTALTAFHGAHDNHEALLFLIGPSLPVLPLEGSRLVSQPGGVNALILDTEARGFIPVGLMTRGRDR